MISMGSFVFCLLVIVAAAGDVMTLRIPNLLVGCLAIAFVPFAVGAGFPVWMLLEHGATAAVLLIAGYAFFSLGYIGAGDAKMMAAIGLWLGVAPSVIFVILAALAGGVLAGAIGIWFMIHVETGLRSERADKLLAAMKPDVPYGLALAMGAILATPYSWLSIAP